jgi:hypothetical protein
VADSGGGAKVEFAPPKPIFYINIYIEDFKRRFTIKNLKA